MATKKKAKTAKKTAKKATKGKKTAKKVAKKTAKSTVKKTAKKATKKAAKPAKKTAKVKTKRKPNAKFMAPMKVSETLAAVVGPKPIPRTEVTKKLWQYIKKNNLQDKVQRRQINADDKLKAVFGGRASVSMFEMTKLVSKHLSPNS